MTTAYSDTPLPGHVAQLYEYLFGFVNVFLLNTGLELGVFEELRQSGADGLTVAELARRKGLHEPYLSVWCRCAYGCGYLDVHDADHYRLAPLLEQVLTNTRHPAYMGHLLRLFATSRSFDLLDHTEYLQTGEIVPSGAHGDEFTLLAQHGVTTGRQFVELVVPQLPRVACMLQEGVPILDIGCGTGTFLCSLAHAYPRCRGVGIDREECLIEEGERTIRAAGLHDRVRVLCRNASTLIFDNAFGLVTLNSGLRALSAQQQEDVLTRCFAALKPGGILLVTELALPESLADLRTPTYRTTLMNMLMEMTKGHQYHTTPDVVARLTTAGFVNVSHQRLGDQSYMVCSGEKPLACHVRR